MKIRLILIALFSCLMGSAMAESGVTLYGNLDSGFLSSQLGGNINYFSQYTSGWMPTFFGFKGAEDLGGGLEASFRLESGFDLSTGATGQYPPKAVLFNRQASVALRGDFGSIGLGLLTDPLFLSLLAVDPRQVSNIGSGLQGFTMGNGTSNNANAVGYTSNDLAGLVLRAQYAFGEVPGNTKAASIYSAGAVYKKDGLIISAGWFSKKDPTGNLSNRGNLIGAGYEVGNLTIKAYYSTYNAEFLVGPGNTISPSRLGTLDNVGFGGKYAISPLLDIDFGYYTLKDSGSASKMNANTLASGLFYKLSKRTTLYGQLVSIDNKGGNTAQNALFVNNGDTTMPGVFMTTNGQGMQYNVGIRHAF